MLQARQWLLAIAAMLFAAPGFPVTPNGSAAVALTKADVDAWLDGYLPYALQISDIAGAVVAVVKDGEIVTQRGYGFADVAARKPVDPALTMFRIGSVSKLFTWTAVMQLEEQGKIDLDADVNRYLDFRIPALDGKPVTMRNLMQHTAGFEEQRKGIVSSRNDVPSFDALLKAYVPERVFDAGSTPAYSNYGASLAGYIVQRVSGEPFERYIERHIFEPLDMQHSSFRQPLPPALAPFMSKGYSVASEPAQPFEFLGPVPAGSMSAAAEDMAHFMIAHLQEGEYSGQRILKEATARQMHDSPFTLLPPLNRMELGFFETNINGREVIGHLGDTQWFHTSLHLFLADHIGLFVSFNSLGKERAAPTLRWALFQDFADRYLPAAVPLPVVAQVDKRTALHDGSLMSGTWEGSRGSRSNFLKGAGFLDQIEVGVSADGELTMPFPGLNGKPRHWVEVARFVWQDTASHDRAAAQVVNGKPVRFSFDELSPFIVFDRVPWYASSSWLLPLLAISVAAMLLTGVLWPVTAIVRRRYHASLTLEPAALRAYRASKVAALAILAGVVLWSELLMMTLKNPDIVSGRFDALFVFAEVFGLVVFVGGLALMLWNLLLAWRGGRRWPARLWSIVLTVGALCVVWMGTVFQLFKIGTYY